MQYHYKYINFCKALCTKDDADGDKNVINLIKEKSDIIGNCVQ